MADCGTTFNPNCIGRLLFELHTESHLIGVTARQRVETPNAFFHPCLHTPIPFLQGKHTEFASPPCWKCYLAFLLSPAPLQGFEFEASLIMNSSMFNLVEALPVLPGPCQLLNYQKVRQFEVVKEYFTLLFQADEDDDIPAMFQRISQMSKGAEPQQNTSRGHSRNSSFNDLEGEFSFHGDANLRESLIEAVDRLKKIGFQDFLRLNMRLAEDRILSFVTVFCTGYGTKWIPGKL